MHNVSINLYTSRSGGPLTWGRQLEYKINRQDGFKVRHIHDFSKLLLAPLFQRADIVHSTIPITTRLWSKPYILTIKGDFRIEKHIWRSFYRNAITIADTITVPSIFLKERLGLKNAVVIPNAINPSIYQTRKGAIRDFYNWLTVTNFDFYDKAQGVLKILTYLDRISSYLRGVHYTVVGGGKYLSRIRSQARLFSTPVEFIGYANPKSFYDKSGLFLYYSSHDNMPNVILEAMASGLCVVTNDVGAVREMIISRQDGFISSSDDEYMSFLEDINRNISIASLIGSVARKTVELKFNWDIVAEEYINLYITVCKK